MEETLTEEVKEVKRTFAIAEDLFVKLENLAYWDRTTQKDILNEALEQYFADKEVKPIPDKQRKGKRGRKPA
ncbi:hypothetical protein [Pontibacter virosus]|uniref:hypothetical protein n=1 Tax=Pontibacter virosus TaxID=1765052 RepID=UPI000E30B3D8|nr:hypothetical protein [Pontibacter virosus]